MTEELTSYGPSSANYFNYLGKISFKILLVFIINPKSDTLLLIIGKSIKDIIEFKGDGEWITVGIPNFLPIFIKEGVKKSATIT